MCRHRRTHSVRQHDVSLSWVLALGFGGDLSGNSETWRDGFTRRVGCFRWESLLSPLNPLRSWLCCCQGGLSHYTALVHPSVTTQQRQVRDHQPCSQRTKLRVPLGNCLSGPWALSVPITALSSSRLPLAAKGIKDSKELQG